MEVQRARMLAAAAETVAELSYPKMTVAEVINRAGVSRKTFYDAFANREDCFLALLEQSLAYAATLAAGTYDTPSWRTGVRAALFRLLTQMEREPGLARLWIVESLRSSERVLERRAQVLNLLASVIGEGRSEGVAGTRPPDIVAHGIVSGVIGVLHERIVSARGAPLTDLLGPLMYMITLPYLGGKAARFELTAPTPDVTPDARNFMRGTDPLDGLSMRLTYRTLRVLVAIAERPGASNREISADADIVDEGQISKLLGRLARLQLVENHGLGHEKGRSNAWRLTGRGAAVVHATRQTAHPLA
jgi:AcrR family transcriptional regulator